MKCSKKLLSMIIALTMVASVMTFSVTANATTFPKPVTVQMLSGVDVNMMTTILNSLPSDTWTFSQNLSPVEGTHWSFDNYYKSPYPLINDNMCMYTEANFPNHTSDGLCWGNRYNAVIKAGETSDDVKQRVWHELLHGIPEAESSDSMHYSSGFIFWMMTHYPSHGFLSNPIGYTDYTETLLKWNQYLQESYAAPQTYYSYNDATWTSHGISLGTAQTGKRHIEFDATPSAANIDGSIDYADTSATVTGFDQLAMQVRFNPSGYFDVRNGASFAKTATVNYSANTKYRIEIVANMSAHTYSVFVTPSGGSRTQIANNYAFRSSAPTTDDAGKLFVVSESANNLIKVENHKISASYESFNAATWTSNGVSLGPQNNGFDSNPSTQKIECDLTPLASGIDGSIDYTDYSTTVTGFNSLSVQVRFNPSGYFDVRNGASFTKTNTVNYTANTRYHVRIVVNLDASTYSVWITPSGGSETQIASSYSFRTGSPAMDDVGKLFIVSESANNLFKVDNHITRYNN